MGNKKEKKLISNEKSGTSVIEQMIYYNIKQFFSDALNRKKIELKDGTYEVDIFIPSIKTAIEYDGVYWHKNKEAYDNYKNNVLNSENIYVIRIREFGLPKMRPFDGKEICLNKKVKTKEIITDVVHAVSSRTNDKVLEEKMELFELSDEDFLVQQPEISKMLFFKEKENNILTLPASTYWNYQKNTILKPEYINDKTDASAWFTCHEKHDLVFRTLRLFKYEEVLKEKNIHNDFSVTRICPFASFCNTNSCSYYDEECKNLFHRYLEKDIKPCYETMNKLLRSESFSKYFFEFLYSIKDDDIYKVVRDFLIIDNSRLRLNVKINSVNELEKVIEILKVVKNLNIMFNWGIFDTNDYDRDVLIDKLDELSSDNFSLFTMLAVELRNNNASVYLCDKFIKITRKKNMFIGETYLSQIVKGSYDNL